MVLLVIVGLIMAIAAVLFALQNAAMVSINFGIWQLEQSLAVVLLGTLGLGIVISTLLSLPTIFKRGWQNSQQRQKIESLQHQLKANNQAGLTRDQYHLARQESSQSVLQAFSLVDEVTGVLTKDAVIKLAEYLLQQLASQNSPYRSLVVTLLAIEPGKSNRSFADLGNENAVYKAIAKRLNQAIAPDSWLGITERKRFVGVAVNLKGVEVNEYITYLQKSVTESPLQKADGVLLPLKMTVGAVVVELADTADSRQVLKQAEQNLEKSLLKGRGNSEISEFQPKSI
ncbi:MAG: LapA family protein [Cyanobacteria bacterium J06600_6]